MPKNKKSSTPPKTPAEALEAHIHRVTNYDEKQHAENLIYDWLQKMPVSRGQIDHLVIPLSIELPVRDAMHLATAAISAGLPVQDTLNEILARDTVATALHEEFERYIAFREGDKSVAEVHLKPKPRQLVTGTVAEWAAALPKGNGDEMQTAPVNLTMSVEKWGQLAHGATRQGMAVEELLNRLFAESCEFWDCIDGNS